MHLDSALVSVSHDAPRDVPSRCRLVCVCESHVQRTSNRVSCIKPRRNEGILGDHADDRLGDGKVTCQSFVAAIRTGIWARGSKPAFFSVVASWRQDYNKRTVIITVDETSIPVTPTPTVT